MADHGDSDDRSGHSASDLGGVLLSEQSLDELLELVVATAVRSSATADGVTITLGRNGGLLTSHASDEVVRELDEVQYGAEEGPCVDAASGDSPVSFMVSDEPQKYPALARVAAQRFITAVLSVPLRVEGDNLGALNFYSASASRFDDPATEAAKLFAREASILLANAIAYAQTTSTVDQLQEALGTRDVIGQAKGILIARTGCSADAAFDELRQRSQDTHRKLRDVAADLVAEEQGRAR